MTFIQVALSCELYSYNLTFLNHQWKSFYLLFTKALSSTIDSILHKLTYLYKSLWLFYNILLNFRLRYLLAYFYSNYKKTLLYLYYFKRWNPYLVVRGIFRQIWIDMYSVVCEKCSRLNILQHTALCKSRRLNSDRAAVLSKI